MSFKGARSFAGWQSPNYQPFPACFLQCIGHNILILFRLKRTGRVHKPATARDLRESPRQHFGLKLMKLC
jgi:hypothetical protein